MRKNKRQIFGPIEVVDAGAKGKSMAKAPDGRVIFLTNAIPGDIVDIETYKKRKTYFEGVATKFHAYSTRRATPPCDHFGTCGGCKWQHMGYQHQLYFKQKEVENNLKRIGGLELPEISPIIGSEKQYFYRNKMEFSFSDSRWLSEVEIRSAVEITNRNALGFHIPGMWDKILDIKKCHLQADPSNAIRLAIKSFAEATNMTFFNPKRQQGLLRTVMIRTTSTEEIMVVIQFFEDDPSKRELLLAHLIQTFPNITSLQYSINQKQNDTIYDQEVVCFYGQDHITEEMGGLQFMINAKSFYQTNSAQAHKLYGVVRDYAGLMGEELVYDLYTGTGTIAQFIAEKAKRVIGIESVPEAINDAKANAKNNHIGNVDFFVGDMKTIFDPIFITQNGRPDVVITDPPRNGMHKKVVGQLLNIAPNKIVYVSCNSATQARDLALMDALYKVVKVQPVDMFPQTHHVENVVLLQKR